MSPSLPERAGEVERAYRRREASLRRERRTTGLRHEGPPLAGRRRSGDAGRLRGLPWCCLAASEGAADAEGAEESAGGAEGKSGAGESASKQGAEDDRCCGKRRGNGLPTTGGLGSLLLSSSAASSLLNFAAGECSTVRLSIPCMNVLTLLVGSI